MRTEAKVNNDDDDDDDDDDKQVLKNAFYIITWSCYKKPYF